MPTSRKNKNRNENLINYKKQNKKMENQPAPINENVKANLRIAKRPMWQTNDSFPISGGELEFLTNFFAPYREALSIMDRVIATAELEDKISLDLVYEDGTMVPDEDPRKKEILSKEVERVNNWKKIVKEKQDQMMEAANKAKDMLDSIEDKNSTDEVVEKGKEIPFVSQSIH